MFCPTITQYGKRYAAAKYEHLDEYLVTLSKLRVPEYKRIRVLDVGCGPGNWSIAFAKYNNSAEVIGIDLDPMHLKLADHYKRLHNCSNVKFMQLDYREIPENFLTAEFDYVIAMGVLQYLDEKQFFSAVAPVLRREGIVLIFWTHSIGYCVEKLAKAVCRMDSREAFSAVAAMLSGFFHVQLSRLRDHAVAYYYTQKVARKQGIGLERLQFQELDFAYYSENYHGIPYVLNLRGTRQVANDCVPLACF